MLCNACRSNFSSNSRATLAGHDGKSSWMAEGWFSQGSRPRGMAGQGEPPRAFAFRPVALALSNSHGKIVAFLSAAFIQ
eukprot:3130593-Rhodomonas_salina.2